jgi:O-6-methylguanine DNA methyltransferase
MLKNFSPSNPFAARVYDTIIHIPPGLVATYGAVAAAMGATRAARAVGTALKKNPFAPRVPCHRVVRADGSFGGYAQGGAKKKRAMLVKEGVSLRGDRVEPRCILDGKQLRKLCTQQTSLRPSF